MSCPECHGTNVGGQIVHLRSCSRAFGKANRLAVPVQIVPDPPSRPSVRPSSISGSRSLASLTGQIERESFLRRTIAGACPRIPYALVSAVVERCVTLDLELEAKGENER